MAVTWGTKIILKMGNRKVIIGETSAAVDSGGDSFSAAALGLSSIEKGGAWASPQGGTYATQVVANSNDGTVDSSSGALYLKPATSSILNVIAVGK